MTSAIIFGASGFIGTCLLNELLDNAAYDKITIVVRKPLPIQHPKLTTLIGDLHSLHNIKDQIRADEVFIALGTTKKNTPDLVKYYEIDHDYPVLAANIAKDNGARSVLLVSAVGSNPDSKVFYIRTKGKVEADIIALGYPHTHIFQPSMLLGTRKENRPMEKFLQGLFSAINPLLLGGLKKYRGIEGTDLARSMINAAADKTVTIKRYAWSDMKP